MCEQTEVQYLEGDVVWVKLGNCWWPGEVKDFDKIDEDIKNAFKKPPIAVVKFFQEDTFEYVKNLDNIYKYNCRKKNEFIKKGLDKYRKDNDFMKKFPADVITAEELTNGDPNILNSDEFAPEQKKNYNDIFGTPNPKKTPKDNLRGKGRLSERVVKADRLVFQRPYVRKSDYGVTYLEQNTPPPNTSKYTCHICGYVATRLNVMVMHNKSHIRGYISPNNKRVVKKRKSPNTNQNRKATKLKFANTSNIDEDIQLIRQGYMLSESEEDGTESDEEEIEKEVTKKSAKRPKAVKKITPASKKPKVASTVACSDLLAEWSDNDNEDMNEINDKKEEEKVAEAPAEQEAQSAQAAPASNNQEKNNISSALLADWDANSDNEKEETTENGKDCFDFKEENEFTVLQKSPGRKIPRVIPRKSIEKLDEKTEAELEAEKKDKEAFENLLEETAVPEIPVSDSLKSVQNFQLAKPQKSPDKSDDKTNGAMSECPIPKKRFARNFEDFELSQNETKNENDKDLEVSKLKNQLMTKLNESPPKSPIIEEKRRGRSKAKVEEIVKEVEEQPKVVQIEKTEESFEKFQKTLENQNDNKPEEVKEPQTSPKEEIQKEVEKVPEVQKRRSRLRHQKTFEESSEEKKDEPLEEVPKVVESQRQTRKNQKEQKEKVTEDLSEEATPLKGRRTKRNQKTEDLKVVEEEKVEEKTENLEVANEEKEVIGNQKGRFKKQMDDKVEKSEKEAPKNEDKVPDEVEKIIEKNDDEATKAQEVIQKGRRTKPKEENLEEVKNDKSEIIENVEKSEVQEVFSPRRGGRRQKPEVEVEKVQETRRGNQRNKKEESIRSPIREEIPETRNKRESLKSPIEEVQEIHSDTEKRGRTSKVMEVKSPIPEEDNKKKGRRGRQKQEEKHNEEKVESEAPIVEENKPEEKSETQFSEEKLLETKIPEVPLQEVPKRRGRQASKGLKSPIHEEPEVQNQLTFLQEELPMQKEVPEEKSETQPETEVIPIPQPEAPSRRKVQKFLKSPIREEETQSKDLQLESEEPLTRRGRHAQKLLKSPLRDEEIIQPEEKSKDLHQLESEEPPTRRGRQTQKLLKSPLREEQEDKSEVIEEPSSTRRRRQSQKEKLKSPLREEEPEVPIKQSEIPKLSEFQPETEDKVLSKRGRLQKVLKSPIHEIESEKVKEVPLEEVPKETPKHEETTPIVEETKEIPKVLEASSSVEVPQEPVSSSETEISVPKAEKSKNEENISIQHESPQVETIQSPSRRRGQRRSSKIQEVQNEVENASVEEKTIENVEIPIVEKEPEQQETSRGRRRKEKLIQKEEFVATEPESKPEPVKVVENVKPKTIGRHRKSKDTKLEEPTTSKDVAESKEVEILKDIQNVAPKTVESSENLLGLATLALEQKDQPEPETSSSSKKVATLSSFSMDFNPNEGIIEETVIPVEETVVPIETTQNVTETTDNTKNESPSKLMEILTDKKKVALPLLPKPLLPKNLVKLDKTKFLIKSSPKTTKTSTSTNKPIILSEKIIKPVTETETVSVRKVTSKRTYQDVEDIDTFIIEKPKKPNLNNDDMQDIILTPKSEVKQIKGRSTARGKPKIIEQTIIKAADVPTETGPLLDDAMFDINSMPIVLSDSILTPESIESMPVITDMPKTPNTENTVLKRGMLQQVKLLKKPETPQVQPQPQSATKTVIKGIIPKGLGKNQKVYASSTKLLKSNPAVITQPGKPGKFIILPTSTPSTSTGSKYTVGKRIAVKEKLPSEPSGNKIMIITNNQGEQSRVLLTPAQQKMLAGKGLPTTKITKTLKNVPKSILTSKGTLLPITQSPKTIVTQKTIVPTQKLVTSEGQVLTPLTPQQLKNIKPDPKRTQKIQQRIILPEKKVVQGKKTILLKNPTTQTYKKPETKVETSTKVEKKAQTPLVSSTVPPLAPITKKEDTKEVPAEQKHLIIQDNMGNQTTVTEGQILALPKETVDGQPQSYMLVTVDESGNLVPLSNEALMTLDPNLAQGGDVNNLVLQFDPNQQQQEKEVNVTPSQPEAAVTTEPSPIVDQTPTQTEAIEQQTLCNINTGDSSQQLIITGDPESTQKFLASLSEGNTDLSSLLSGTDGNIIINADGQQILLNADPESQILLMPSVDQNLYESQIKNQDILAAALADTDVFQQEAQTQEKDDKTIYPVSVGNVLETSLTLGSPIMTPLEVPSNKKVDKSTESILTVPSSLELPITITDPSITQTVSQQVMLSNELQSNLELPISVSETIQTSEYLNIPSSENQNESFSSLSSMSMPLLTEEPDKGESQSEASKDDVVEMTKKLSNITNTLEMNDPMDLDLQNNDICDSLSEPPPGMFEKTSFLNDPYQPEQLAEDKSSELTENSPKFVVLEENSCEIPVQPQIITNLNNQNLDSENTKSDDLNNQDTTKND